MGKLLISEWFVLENDVPTLAFECWVDVVEVKNENGQIGCSLVAHYYYERQKYVLRKEFFRSEEDWPDARTALFDCLRQGFEIGQRLGLAFILNESRPIVSDGSDGQEPLSDRLKLLFYEQRRGGHADALGSAYLEWIDRSHFRVGPVTKKSRLFQWFEKVEDAPSGE